VKDFLQVARWGRWAVLLIAVSGCSTIYGRQNDAKNVYFESNAEKTSVSCGSETIIAPGNIALKQSRNHTCMVSAEGYELQRFRIHSFISKEGFNHSSKMNWNKWGKWTLEFL